MRSESSALSLHHIKTTELFSRFGTPVYQRARRAYGNRAVLTAVRFRVGVKKTTVFTVVLVLPCISEPAERTGIGTTERRPSISSRDNKSRHKCVCFLVLPYSSEPAERTGTGLCQQPFDSPLGVKKRLSSQSFWYSRRESNP